MKVFAYLTGYFDQTVTMRDGTEFDEIWAEIREPEAGEDFVGILDLSKVSLDDIRRMQNRFYAMGNCLSHELLEDYAATRTETA